MYSCWSPTRQQRKIPRLVDARSIPSHILSAAAAPAAAAAAELEGRQDNYRILNLCCYCCFSWGWWWYYCCTTTASVRLSSLFSVVCVYSNSSSLVVSRIRVLDRILLLVVVLLLTLWSPIPDNNIGTTISSTTSSSSSTMIRSVDAFLLPTTTKTRQFAAGQRHLQSSGGGGGGRQRRQQGRWPFVVSSYLSTQTNTPNFVLLSHHDSAAIHSMGVLGSNEPHSSSSTSSIPTSTNNQMDLLSSPTLVDQPSSSSLTSSVQHSAGIVIPTIVNSSPTTTDSTTITSTTAAAATTTTTTVVVVPVTEEISTATIMAPVTGLFNVVLTHATADFDSLASAVGLAKLWTAEEQTKHHIRQQQQLLQQDQQLQQHDPYKDEEENEYHTNGKKHIDTNNNNQEIDPRLANGLDKSSSFDHWKSIHTNHDQYHYSSMMIPTFVVLPRGAHPSVQRFLALHQHLFPIRSLKSLPHDLSLLNKLALVDAQRKERLGPAESLLQYAKHITVYDHHIDQDSDIPATDYIVEHVGSVTTMIVERIQKQQQQQQQQGLPTTVNAPITITEAEATLLALGIHADTGSLCYDSTTPRDAYALAWCLSQGASQTAISEHVQSSLNTEQQAVLTQALININSTVMYGATISTALLTSDGFIQGLAAVTQDALELSSSDIFLLAMVYQTQSGGQRKKKRSQSQQLASVTQNTDPIANGHSKSHQGTTIDAFSETLTSKTMTNQALLTSRLLPKPNRIVTTTSNDDKAKPIASTIPSRNRIHNNTEILNSLDHEIIPPTTTAAAMPTTMPNMRMRLRAIFDRQDIDMSGTIDRQELAKALAASGVVLSAKEDSLDQLMQSMDQDGDGFIDFDEFVHFVQQMELVRHEQQLQYSHLDDNDELDMSTSSNDHIPSTRNSIEQQVALRKPLTMILIGRVKAGITLKSVKLNKLLEPLGGGGHAKAASATTRIRDLDEAQDVLEGLVHDLITNSLQAQPTVGEFMMSPVLSVQPHMTDKQVEDLFTRYDVRALPVVDEDNNVIGLVTYKEVAAAQQRQWNKEKKRLQQRLRDGNNTLNKDDELDKVANGTPEPTSSTSKVVSSSSTVKAWMLQHVQVVEASQTLAEVELLLLDADVGTIPVVADGTRRLVGMVSRTDLLRQHRYYHSLPYHNKGYADTIANRRPIIELRKRLKRFDLD